MNIDRGVIQYIKKTMKLDLIERVWAEKVEGLI